MPTVCILYGFGEGPRVSRRFQKALTDKGLKITHDPERAEIIITHSAGCLLLPSKIQAKQIIQIGPYWPKRAWIFAATGKFLADMHLHRKKGELDFWLRKSFWNFVYFCKMPTNIRFLKGIKNRRHWRHGEITTIVRPRFDSFCEPWPKSLPFDKAPTFVSFPGHHDDCWRNPKPYIALIKS